MEVEKSDFLERPNYILLRNVISDIKNYVCLLWDTIRNETKSLINSWTQYIINIEKYLKFVKERFPTLKKVKRLDSKLSNYETKVERFLDKFSDFCLSQKFRKPTINVNLATMVLSKGEYPYLPQKIKMDLPVKPKYIDNWIFKLTRPSSALYLSIMDSGITLQTNLYFAKFLDYSFGTPNRKLILVEFSFQKIEVKDNSDDRRMLEQLNMLAMEDRRRNSFELDFNSESISKGEEDILPIGIQSKGLLTLETNSAPWPMSKDLEKSILDKGRDAIIHLQSIHPESEILIKFDEWVIRSIENEKSRRS